MLVGNFDPVGPGDQRFLSIDFSADLDAGDAVATSGVTVDGNPVANAIVTVSVSAISKAQDENASKLAVEKPVLLGNQIMQWIGGPYVAGQTGFQPGVIYVVTMAATTVGGRTLVHCARLPCAPLP